ncbi:hypothetical protein M9H77_29606 [Catharanthus roseus]|uniref:Uncharacterized protein n=1 Tax=Catharanthus roseus TaxID=4058 RepID=A0ACB9ZV92_CATRO|nr:hypothetical protein M9H77_29606 [Catharanthus roseus]
MQNSYRKIMSEKLNGKDSQLLTHYNEGTGRSSNSNLNPMKVIMQELQQMRKDMKDMRGNMTTKGYERYERKHDYSIYRDIITSLLMLDLMSIVLMIAMRTIDLEVEMVVMIELIIEFQGMMSEMKGIM